MQRLSAALARLSGALGASTLVVMTLMVIVDIVMRSLFQRSLGFVEEVTGYLVVLVTLFGVAITFRQGAMFRVSFLYDRFPVAVQRVLGVVYLIASAVFCALMLWFTSLLVSSSFTRGKIAATELETPLYLPQLVLPAGFLVLLVFIVDRLIRGGGVIQHDGEGAHGSPSGE
jgi:TRAP-type C4-dicarboxylate transport system permease small subunit